MLLLHQPDTASSNLETRGITAVFGVGLVGSAVADALRRLANWRKEFCPLSWDDAGLQHDHLGQIFEQIRQSLQDNSAAKPRRLQIVWAAGKAGFGSTDAETARELDNFAAVANHVEHIAEAFPQTPITFHHVSSVGGLFEGQRSIRRDSTPSTRRPYGRLKLSQEELLLNLNSRIVKRIYRLTSVIGPAVGPYRRGLVGTLIDDGLHHRTTRLVGLPTTLRDYVWHSDIGRYIAECVLDDKRANTPCKDVLASAKPSTIHEVIDVIESLFRRHLYTQRAAVLSNDADMTVCREALPADWRPTDLFTCVSQIYRDALAHQPVPRQIAKVTP